VKYRKLKGYKYETLDDELVEIPEIQVRAWNDYISLDHGILIIKQRYAWDGASGPAFDTKTFMLGSLIHDALYQLMREGKLDRKWRKRADMILRRVCISEGMGKFRAWYAYRFVRIFGRFTCKRRKNPRGRIITV